MDKNLLVEDLDFSVRTWKCLRKAGIDTLGALAEKSADELLAIPNMGHKSLDEVAGRLKELGVVLEGYQPEASKAVLVEVNGPTVNPPVLSDKSFWAEIRNDFFESGAEIWPEEGDVLATIAIDAWKTDDENEEGCVIACVMLSNHGDVLVDYRDNLAMHDEMAQEAIREAKGQLREYFQELQELQEDLNDMKNEKILYFGEGHFVAREALQRCAVAAAEDFVSKVNKPGGKRDGNHSFTYDFGSPFDELDMHCGYEREGENRGWWTSCVLYAKGQEAPAEASAMLSVQTTTDVNDIAATFLELIEDELDCPIEINFVSHMKMELEALENGLSVDAKLQDANIRSADENAAEDRDVVRENVKE